MNRNSTPSNRYLYKTFRNRVVAEQCKSKIDYFQKYFETKKTNTKMLWSDIRSIVNVKTKSQLSQISHLLENGKQVDNPVKMANKFNNYFVNVGGNIDKSIPRTRKSPMDYLSNRIPNSIFSALVTKGEIDIIIESLNQKKAIGSYSIPVFLLKILSRNISEPRLKTVNQSFETGIFPDCWKTGKGNPLHKKDSYDNPSDYRPISNLSDFSITFELMHKRLCNILTHTKYSTIFNLASMRNIHALLSFTDTIKHSIDKGKFGCGIFLDLQKAFDTLSHSILLQSLEHYGIRDNALHWFKSDLSGRSQHVTVNGYASNMLNITCGVPQGPVLGP